MFQILANLLAFFYGLIPNYAVAIALLTFTVMLVLSPLTLKSTRSMLAMQKLQPEMKRLQQQHKGDRQKLNEEMMALYKEHGANPVAGCLPMILQMPVFLVMYRVISGLTRKGPDGFFMPRYLDPDSELYKALSSSKKMVAFGVDLARSATEGHGSFPAALPFFILVALVVLTQYYQTRQTMSRNTASAANAQQQILLKVMPVMFGLISLSIQAGLNIYFLASALFRIAQTGGMYRFDPALAAHARSHAIDVEARLDAKSKRPPGGRSDKGPKSDPDQPDGKPGKPKLGPKQPGPKQPGPKQTNGRPAKTNGARPGGRPSAKRRTKRGR